MHHGLGPDAPGKVAGKETAREYRPADYALIGDEHSAALVASDGSIDWCCWPRFDSPAVFCRLLDARRGGFFRVGPAGRHQASRAYVGDTNVLATVFTSAEGRIRVTDFMPVEPQDSGRGEDIALHDIARLVEGLSGEVEVEVAFRPTFDFARGQTTITPIDGGAVASAGKEALRLSCPAALSHDATGGVSGRFRVADGERVWLTLRYDAENANATWPAVSDRDAEETLARTLRYWEDWSGICTYHGPYEALVRRSALTLKLLTFKPTGALVAAPTTSLPEEIGGVRNWDYRFTWLRDSSLILDALVAIGYHEEATDFFNWLEELWLCCREPAQIMYAVRGESDILEQVLDHLEGYRRSRPVRIGNAAAGQVQLDVYGEILEAAHLCYERMRPVKPDLWAVLRLLADRAATRWREPDHGIWEVRTAPRHFLYSKILCWVALDRALRLAGGAKLPGDIARWQHTRDEIQRVIGFNREIGAFVQAFDHHALDASALVIPLVGFLPATDPRVRSTVERIQEQLTCHGLVYRYLTDDGLPGSEATFALCSFWLVDNLALSGRVDEARDLFDRIVRNANDVGLLAEEIEPVTRELLGNFPQGFAHLALIRSALNIAKAEAEGAETHAKVPAERHGREASR